MTENRLLRKCYLDRKQVPTLSVMKKHMSPALADIYFKSMTPKLKVLAGIEPPMQGAGNTWYVSPKDLLKGRVVMKPFHSRYMSQLSWYGIDEMGMKLVVKYHDQMKEQINKAIEESDDNCKQNVQISCRQHWAKCASEEANSNSEHIKELFSEFCDLYTTSFTKLQDLLFDSAQRKIKETKNAAFQEMQSKYKYLLHQQSTMLVDRYTKKLEDEKVRLKTTLIENLETSAAQLNERLHDINVEKHIAVEKLRNFLECRNLACQVYVALKERQECIKEMEATKHEYSDKMKTLAKAVMVKDYQIHIAQQREKKRQAFENEWRKKVCHIVKKLQMFISYSLRMIPEQAEFFINMEKLMLLQLAEAVEKPSVESIFKPDIERVDTPDPAPRPFYLFCDKTSKPTVDPDLCPKHCGSSASQLPVIVVNKRCIYAACDNFEQFTDKIRAYVHGKVIDDANFDDDYNYDHYVPVKVTSTEQVQELKLQNSLLQILQQEIANIRGLSIECEGCKIPHCYDCYISSEPSKVSLQPKTETKIQPSLSGNIYGEKVMSRQDELDYKREPKLENYLKYVLPNKCDCSKLAKRHLRENLPAYMTKMSTYDAPELANYETCSLTRLKTLVKQAKDQRDIISLPSKPPSKTKDINIQCSDVEFEYLCTCFSDDDANNFIENLVAGKKASELSGTNQFRVVGSTLSTSFLNKESKCFVEDRALSLRKLVDESSEVKEIFKRNDCIDFNIF